MVPGLLSFLCFRFRPGRQLFFMVSRNKLSGLTPRPVLLFPCMSDMLECARRNQLCPAVSQCRSRFIDVHIQILQGLQSIGIALFCSLAKPFDGFLIVQTNTVAKEVADPETILRLGMSLIGGLAV